MPEEINRKKILPPYLDNIDAWTDYADAIDAVWKTRIDDPTYYLATLRDLYLLLETGETKVEQQQMVPLTDFIQAEREILIKQSNMIGFDFRQTDLLTDDDYLRISRNLSLYWYAKGTENFSNFLGFVLNTIIQIDHLWAPVVFDSQGQQQYGEFLAVGESGIGTPVWDGGTWFPTTHIRIRVDPVKFNNVSVQKIVSLFYAVANYNLVIDRIDLDTLLFIHTYDDPEIANSVVAYPYFEIEITILPLPYVQGALLLNDGSNILLADGTSRLLKEI